jgi:hypothetical protein
MVKMIHAVAVLEGDPMVCLELQELESRHSRYNEFSLNTRVLLAEGRGEFSKWHRAGRARLAFDIQMHRQNCSICQSLKP